MRVRWLPLALQVSDIIFEMIAADNPSAALHMVDRFEAAAEHVSRFPYLGRPGRVAGTREYVVPGTPYLIPYRVIDQEIQLLRIYHASRSWPDSL